MIHEAVRTTLISNTAVTEIIDSKVFPARAPQDILPPYVTYQAISNNADQHLCGRSGLEFTRMQINCWSASYKEVQELAEAVRDALLAAAGSVNNTFIQGVTSEGRRDTYDDPQSGEGVGVCGVSEDFMFSFNNE